MTTTTLPQTTTARLLAVADIIESEPDRWDQDVWALDDEGSDPDIELVAGTGPECGTTACVAGWGVKLCPDVPTSDPEWGIDAAWFHAGAYALGLAYDLAHWLFLTSGPHRDGDSSGDWVGEGADTFAEALRLIATIPEGSRTLERARETAGNGPLHYFFNEVTI